MSLSTRRALLELAVLVAIGTLHLLWPEGLSRAWFTVPVVLGGVVVLAGAARRDPHLLNSLGLRRLGLPETALACALLLLTATPVMLLIGWLQEAEVRWVFPVTLLLYPLWGLAQQLLVQGVLTRNLVKVLPASLAAFISASLFGLVHCTYGPPLMVATFALGLVFAPLYLRYRNLWALGLTHGWLGTLFYTFVLLRDPLGAYLQG